MRKRHLNTAKALALAMMLTAAVAACSNGKENNSQKAESTQPAEGQQAPTAAQQQQTAAQQTTDADENEGWTVATVPMPRGGNPPRFVSNPDGVLETDTENELNRILLYTKVDLGIETRLVVVNHVKDANVESFTFALFDNFEHNENMLIIVLAYQDHGVRLEIGRNLERYISETECQEMLNKVLIPYLREDNPDEGLIRLIEGIYYRVQDKQGKK